VDLQPFAIEFASRIPAWQRYTYAYAFRGVCRIIGWALIMEYSIGNIYVAYSCAIVLPPF
jgi:hypothetical protein